MKFLPGELTFAQIIKAEANADNSGGAVTVLDITTTVVDAALGSVAIGDRIFCGMRCSITKGAAGGDTLISMLNAGTCVGQFLNFSLDLPWRKNPVPANEVNSFHMFGVFKVNVAGTFTLRVQGTSAGSNSTVNAGGCAVHCFAVQGF